MREELQREKLRGRAGGWAGVDFEKRLSEGKGSELARRCWKEIIGRSREGKGTSKWERERSRFFEDRRFREEMKRRRGKGEMGYEEVLKRDKEM